MATVSSAIRSAGTTPAANGALRRSGGRDASAPGSADDVVGRPSPWGGRARVAWPARFGTASRAGLAMTFALTLAADLATVCTTGIAARAEDRALDGGLATDRAATVSGAAVRSVAGARGVSLPAPARAAW